MKIILCAKGVPESPSKVKVAESGHKLDYQTYQLNINESDEYALEQAVILKNSRGVEITMLMVGTSTMERVGQLGWAKGVDRVLRIDADLADAEATAELLAKAIGGMEYDIIFTGVETTDNMSSQVGVSLAERLSLPFAYAVTKVEFGEDVKTVYINKEIGGGVEQVVEMSLPALLCIQSGIVPKTYASVRKILQARSKPIEVITSTDLSPDTETKIKFFAVFPPKGCPTEIIEGDLDKVAVVTMSKIREVI